jgi:ribosome-binding factor A
MARRTDRVNELLRTEISHLLARQIKDPRLSGVISITRVSASNDLRTARVYVSVMGGGETKRLTLDGCQSAAAYLRRELRSRVNLRHTPFLTFELDDSIEEAEQILRLMATLTSDDTAELQFQVAPDEVRPTPRQPANQ